MMLLCVCVVDYVFVFFTNLYIVLNHVFVRSLTLA